MSGFSRIFYAALAAIAASLADRRIESAERWRDRAARWDAMAKALNTARQS